jgi:hypothetical protein
MHGVPDAVGVDVIDALYPAVGLDDAADLALFADVDADPGGVAEQDVVELGAFDLQSGRGRLRQARRHGEGELPRLGVAAPPERAATLDGEAGASDFFRHAEDAAESVHCGRQQ